MVAGDAFLGSRGVQLATLTARDRIPATYAVREPVVAGGLMVNEVTDKRLRLLHDLVPDAVRIAVLVNPGNAPFSVVRE